MHDKIQAPWAQGLPFAEIVRLDRALRKARAAILPFGKLTDLLWTILIELAPESNGLDFETLEVRLSASHGQTGLLACLSTLEEAGLIVGETGTRMSLLAHVNMTGFGQEKIRAVLAAAQSDLRSNGQ